MTLPVAAFTGAERQNGWVAVEAREEQSLRVTAVDAAGQPLLHVDPIDLPGMGEDVTDRRRIVAGVRYVRLGYTVTVAEESFEAAAVPTALADRASTVSVLSESGLMQHQLDVAFRAVGMQSLRFVLPEGSDVWAVLIDGTPAEVRQAGSTYQVPLASTDDPSASREPAADLPLAGEGAGHDRPVAAVAAAHRGGLGCRARHSRSKCWSKAGRCTIRRTWCC